MQVRVNRALCAEAKDRSVAFAEYLTRVRPKREHYRVSNSDCSYMGLLIYPLRHTSRISCATEPFIYHTSRSDHLIDSTHPIDRPSPLRANIVVTLSDSLQKYAYCICCGRSSSHLGGGGRGSLLRALMCVASVLLHKTASLLSQS